MKKKLSETANATNAEGEQDGCLVCPRVSTEGHPQVLNGHLARRSTRTETVIWDAELPGFGFRTRATGYKSWIVKLRERGRQRLITLGRTGELPAPAARLAARRILARAALDGLPTAERDRPARLILGFAAYLDEFWRDYGPHLKPSTLKASRGYARRELVPVFGAMPVSAIDRGDIVRWRDSLATRTGVFNRALPVLAVALGYAEQLGYRRKGSNPSRGIPRYRRKLPERYLSRTEYRRLGRGLADSDHDHPQVVAAIRLLLFTGARLGEIMSLRWDYVREDRLLLPDSKTGPKTVWLNKPAVAVLARLERRPPGELVFPGTTPDRPLVIERHWYRIRRAAALPDVRLHDLRHSFASIAIADRMPLHTIGRLLGHALPETTARYAHLADEVVAEAAERVCGGVADAVGLGI